ncbi:MAG: multicopper oxidase family protein, partial [Anaerolineae bacterium]
MRIGKRSLLSFGTFFLALLAFAVIGGAEAHAQGGASISNLPPETCTVISATRTCHLWAMTGTLTMPDAAVLPVWGFADNAAGPAQVPGPAIVANAGETLEVVLHNELLTETMSLTFPGQMGVLADLDGVAAGGMVTYTFPLTQPGTFLYEAGMTPNGPRQVAMGLYGALVVRLAGAPGQAYDDAATAFADEALVVLGAVDPDLNNDPDGFAMQNYKPSYWLINGAAYPQTAEIDTIAGNVILLRYVNATMRTQGMGLLGLRQTVIGSDGRPLGPAAYGVVNETIASGQTLDVLTSVPVSTTESTKFALYNAGLYLHNAGARLAPDGPLAFGGMMTFINTVTGIPGWQPGPETNNVHVAPSPTTGAGGVTLTADISAATGRTISAAEYFTDSLGLPGSGIPIAVTPGQHVAISVPIPETELAGWPSGYPIFYVRGVDDLSHWGLPGAAVLNLDKAGPAITGQNLSADPTNGSASVELSATGDDRWEGRNGVISGTYSLELGPAQPLALNLPGANVTDMTATLSITTLGGLAEGLHPITIVAQDSLGNWGVPGFVTVTLDTTGPDAPVVTLTPDYLDFTQPPTVTSVRLDALITDAVSSDVQSVVANAEGWVGAVGLPDTGFDLFPKDGLFDEVSEAAYFDMPLSHFSMLPHGTHTITVQAVDVAGNRGALGIATVFVDRGGVLPPDSIGPAITALSVDPHPTGGAAQVTVTADAADPGSESNIAGGEWFVGADPGPGFGLPLSAADGAFDSPSEGLTAIIDVSGWVNANYEVSVRAQDAASNWGPPASVRLRVTGNANVLILSEDFDSGTLDAWSAAVGDVSAAPEASLPAPGGYGLAATVGITPAYVSHVMPPGEAGYRAAFYYDPNGVALGAESHNIFVGLDAGIPLFGIEVEAAQSPDADYEVRAWVLAGGAPVYTGWFDIDDGPHQLGLQWRAAPNAALALLVDGQVVDQLGGLDASGHMLHEVRLGPSLNLSPAMSGTEYFDTFEARR